MYTCSIIQIWKPILFSELYDRMQAGGRRVLQYYVTCWGPPKFEAALLCQAERVNNLAILHCLQLELGPAGHCNIIKPSQLPMLPAETCLFCIMIISCSSKEE